MYRQNNIGFKSTVLLIVLGSLSICSYAINEPLAPNDTSIQELQKTIEANQKKIPDTDVNAGFQLPTQLPTSTDSPDPLVSEMSKEQYIDYLKNNPEEFERFLGQLLIQGNATLLETLLPIYKQVPNYDPSVIDWGQAIITSNHGDLDKAVTMYRAINAKLPNAKVLRFQMAIVLFRNGQYQAAQSEFEQLRSEAANTANLKVIDKYLNAISNRNKWDFRGSVSYLDDDNLSNGPELGTKLVGDNAVITYTTPHQSGRGLAYNFSADKKWIKDNHLFTSFGVGTHGRYYWDNDNYNDVTARVKAGGGYQNATTELEFAPFYSKRWYAGGTIGDGKLSSYYDSVGADITLSQWLNKKWMYQGLARYSDIDYENEYAINNSNDWLLANTLIFFPNATRNLSIGVDYMDREAERDSLAFDRTGVRLGWGQTWPKGYATRLSAGYAERDYDAIDFFGIQRENKEYSAGISLWKRDFSLYGLTPRLEVDYFKVDSNSPFEEYDKTNVSIELTKDF